MDEDMLLCNDTAGHIPEVYITVNFADSKFNT